LSSLKYRPEIDGLRAIAVLAVVLYHAQFNIGGEKLLTGGYIGVDVFFVISGYLISLILLRELASDSFSFATFYERRARRILPALFAVMLASIPIAWLVLLPKALKEYAWSLLASLGFGSNFLFWQEDSYTAESSLLKPFLHTWSLSIEEQFYLIFPILLLLLWRFVKPLLTPLLAILFFASLATAQIGSQLFSDANFFLLPSRGWEMLIGALIACGELARSNAHFQPVFKALGFSQSSKDRLAKLGLALIVGSLFLFNNNTPHPSLLTALPVLGCALVIRFARPGELVTGWLCTPYLSSIGLISYSLYLWHFPLFAFARIQGLLLDNFDKLIVVILSFGAAILSYLFIEKPFRNRRRLGLKRFASILIPCAVIIIGVQVYIIKKDGASFRLGAVAALFENATLRTVPNGNYGSYSERPTIINVGDSHADVLTSNLRVIAERNNANYAQVIESGCPLLKGIIRYDDGKLHERCNEQLNQLWLSSIKSYKDSIVVFSARWTLYLQGQRFDDHQGNIEPGFELLLTTKSNPVADISGITKALKTTINELLENQQKVVLIYPIPEIGWNVPNRIKQELDKVSYGRKLDAFENLALTTSKARFLERSQAAYQLYDSLGEHPNLIRVYPADMLCSSTSDECYTHDDSQLFYYDDNHLTHTAARMLGAELEHLIIGRGWLN